MKREFAMSYDTILFPHCQEGDDLLKKGEIWKDQGGLYMGREGGHNIWVGQTQTDRLS